MVQCGIWKLDSQLTATLGSLNMIKNVLACSAAALLAFAPIAAQAGTRAADAPVSLAPMARLGSPAGSEQQIAQRMEWLLILFFGLSVVGGIFAIESGEDDGSPATGG